MHPVLFEFGPLQLRAYGLALAVSFLVGSGLALRRGRTRGFDEATLISLFWWIVLASVLGARLHYILAHPEQFRRIGDAFRLWEGGLIQYGGMIAALLASWVFLRRRRLSFLAMADVIAPSLALGEGITRIGCFVNGCCFGRACQSALAVHYPPTSYAAQALGPSVGICPSQLFLSAGLFLVAGALLLIEKRRLAVGALFGIFLVLQGAMRYAVDFTRHYDPEDQVTSLGPWIVAKSQVIALLLILLGVALIVSARRRERSAGQLSAAAQRSRA